MSLYLICLVNCSGLQSAWQAVHWVRQKQDILSLLTLSLNDHSTYKPKSKCRCPQTICMVIMLDDVAVTKFVHRRLAAWKCLGSDCWLTWSLNGLGSSVYFILIPLSDNKTEKHFKWEQLYCNFGCIKVEYMCAKRVGDKWLDIKGWQHPTLGRIKIVYKHVTNMLISTCWPKLLSIEWIWEYLNWILVRCFNCEYTFISWILWNITLIQK